MNFRQQVLEAELKTVQVICLTCNPTLAQAARERERELRIELLQTKSSSTAFREPPTNESPPKP